MKLTEAQRRVLADINSKAPSSPRFQTADSLRKLGLVERDTTFIAKRIYANKEGEHLQFDVPLDKLVVWHDWWITPAGRRALDGGGNGE